MSSAANAGLKALKERNYTKALEHLDRALASSKSPAWLLGRSQAHQHLGHLPEALSDAELAYNVAAERGSGNSRTLMTEAQYRRSVVLYKMGRHADADCCAKWSQLLCEGKPAMQDDDVNKRVDENGYYTLTSADVRADTTGQPSQGKESDGPLAQAATSTETSKAWNRAYAWRSQVIAAMEKLPADDAGRKVTVTKNPARQVQKDNQTEEHDDIDDDTADAADDVPEAKLLSKADFYQTGQTVTVSLFVKNVNKANFECKFHDNFVVLHPLPREVAPHITPNDIKSYSTLYLGGQIIPDSARSTVTPRKIELVLQKAQPGVKWATWGEEKIGKPDSFIRTKDLSNPPTIPDWQPDGPFPDAPSYPTSSRTGPKNWDTMVAEYEDEAADSDVNTFFKQLYRNADPDAQRAMMKSFTESNGTSLSTNWEDVGKHKVETVPPEGVEAKKWT